MQDEITTNLSAAIATEIVRAEASAPARPSTDVTAWDRFLKGLSHYYRQTKEDLATAVDLFREAIRLDPKLSIAHAYLATIQIQSIQFGWVKGTREMWAEAMNLAETSVRLDPRSSFAFSILSWAHAMEGHYEAAMDAAKRAVALNPYDMHDPASKPPFDPSIPVSPDNPCPFLRGLVGEGFVDGGTVPLNTLSQTIANASGETGLKKIWARIQVRGVATIANGFSHILKSIWSGPQLDALRGGPLDKLGAGSRILGVDGKVNEDEIARLQSFGRIYTDPNTGVSEPGLNAAEIKTFMQRAAWSRTSFSLKGTTNSL